MYYIKESLDRVLKWSIIIFPNVSVETMKKRPMSAPARPTQRDRAPDIWDHVCIQHFVALLFWYSFCCKLGFICKVFIFVNINKVICLISDTFVAKKNYQVQNPRLQIHSFLKVSKGSQFAKNNWSEIIPIYNILWWFLPWLFLQKKIEVLW